MKTIFTHKGEFAYFDEVIDYLKAYHGTDLKVISYHIECIYEDNKPHYWHVFIEFDPCNRYV